MGGIAPEITGIFLDYLSHSEDVKFKGFLSGLAASRGFRGSGGESFESELGIEIIPELRVLIA